MYLWKLGPNCCYTGLKSGLKTCSDWAQTDPKRCSAWSKNRAQTKPQLGPAQAHKWARTIPDLGQSGSPNWRIMHLLLHSHGGGRPQVFQSDYNAKRKSGCWGIVLEIGNQLRAGWRYVMESRVSAMMSFTPITIALTGWQLGVIIQLKGFKGWHHMGVFEVK